MANTSIPVQFKRTSVSGKVPNTTNIPLPGEAAVNMTDGIMYVSTGNSVFAVGANNVDVRVSNTFTAVSANIAIITSNTATVHNISVSALTANGTVGSADQLLTSNGSAVYWSTQVGYAGSQGTLAGVGVNTAIVFDDSGLANGTLNFTFDKTLLDLTFGNTTSTVDANLMILSNTGITAINLRNGTGGITNTNMTSTFLSVVSGTSNTQITSSSIAVANATVNVFSANLTTIRWVPNTYNFGTVNTAGNGYCFLPGGIMLQWGTVLANNLAGNVTFSTNTGSAFPTAIWSVTATSNTLGGTGSGNWTAVIQANTTQISIRTANTGTTSLVRWMAIGN